MIPNALQFWHLPGLRLKIREHKVFIASYR